MHRRQNTRFMGKYEANKLKPLVAREGMDAIIHRPKEFYSQLMQVADLVLLNDSQQKLTHVIPGEKNDS